MNEVHDMAPAVATVTSAFASVVALASQALPLVQISAAIVGMAAGIYAIRYYRKQLRSPPND